MDVYWVPTLWQVQVGVVEFTGNLLEVRTSKWVLLPPVPRGASQLGAELAPFLWGLRPPCAAPSTH